MTTPVTPQPLEVLKARYPDAIKRLYVYGVDEIIPGKPEHVFDFEEGIRIMVSREQAEGYEFIHFSSSFNEEIKEKYKDKPQELFDRMIQLFKDLSGIDQEPFFKGFSPQKGVPHWIIDIKKAAYDNNN